MKKKDERFIEDAIILLTAVKLLEIAENLEEELKKSEK